MGAKYSGQVVLATLALMLQISFRDLNAETDVRLQEYKTYIDKECFAKSGIVLTGSIREEIYRTIDSLTKDFNLQKYHDDIFRYWLDLYYDLRVAENACNWSMQKKIATEIIDTIGGKYGLTKVEKPENSEIYESVRNFAGLVTVHAFMILNNIDVQEKTTQECRKLLGNVNDASLQKSREEKEQARQEYIAKERGKNRNFKGNLKDFSDEQHTEIGRAQNNVGVDKDLNSFVRNADPTSEVLQKELKIENRALKYDGNNVGEIAELAKVLYNPKHLQLICELALSDLKKYSREGSTRYPILEGHSQIKYTFHSAIEEYVKKTFDFDSNQVLQRITIKYFENALQAAFQVSPYNMLVPEDNWGYDVFGNRYVCSFNSSFNAHRKNPGNKEFVSAGGILTSQQIIDLYKSGGYPNVSQSKSDFTAKYGFDSNWRSIYENELIQSFATNDISSRGRTMLAFLVWTINTNVWLSQGKYIKQGEKNKLKILEYKDAIKNGVMDSPMTKFSYSYAGIGKPAKHPFPRGTHLTPLHLLLGYIPNITDPEYIQTTKYRSLIYAAMGVNIAHYRYYLSESNSIESLWSKGCWQLKIPLYSFLCISPLFPIVAVVERDGHMWSATQQKGFLD